MIIVADINTPWRRLPFQALAEFKPILGLEPMDWLIALRKRRLPWGTRLFGNDNFCRLEVVLSPGWASLRGVRAMNRLWTNAVKVCRSLGQKPSAVVFTSPHYAPLAESLSRQLPIYYYCADDYFNYSGWNVERMQTQEAMILGIARRSFFVSRALCERALKSYQLDPTKACVSSNATSQAFLERVPNDAINLLFERFPHLRRPIVGVVGSIGPRLNLDVLRKVADLSEVGTLVLVGQVDTADSSATEMLLAHPKVVSVGQQPVHQLPVWTQTFDVALIPYAPTEFNWYCSPLRLFDHLAAARPIVATSACAQIAEFSEYVRIASDDGEFVKAVRELINYPMDPAKLQAQARTATLETWAQRGQALSEGIR